MIQPSRYASACGVGLFLALCGPASRAQTPAASPTFSNDVAPIFYKHCASCHRPGDIAPMSLLTYEDARPYARSIRTKVADGLMPPWHADAPAGAFRNDRRLSSTEKETIVAWVAAGAPKGNEADLPPAPIFPAGWSVGTPDVVLTMEKAYEVAAVGEIPYQYFEIPTNFTEDKWVQAIELKPGALPVVHHILAFSREPGGGRRAPVYTARVPDLAEVRRNAAPGFAGAANRGALIATTAPGTNALVFQPGEAMLIKAGSIITFQVHYTASGKAMSDRSSIGFVFAKQPPRREVRSGSFTNVLLAIPPGAAHHPVDAAVEFNVDTRVLALFPHTHLRGTEWEYRLVHPDGRSTVVLSVPRYDFNWQTYYEFAEPLMVPKGARLEARAHYDNSAANKFNPDPKVEVRWGEQTWEEMHYTGITFTVDQADAPSQRQP